MPGLSTLSQELPGRRTLLPHRLSGPGHRHVSCSLDPTRLGHFRLSMLTDADVSIYRPFGILATIFAMIALRILISILYGGVDSIKHPLNHAVETVQIVNVSVSFLTNLSSSIIAGVFAWCVNGLRVGSHDCCLSQHHGVFVQESPSIHEEDPFDLQTIGP